MKDYQKRVVEEQISLAEKIEKLRIFLASKEIKSVPMIEQADLYRQFAVMADYIMILNRRIERF